VSVIFA